MPDETDTFRRTGFSHAFRRPLLTAFGAVLILFGIYEIVERLWLSGLSMQALHTLHIVRGLIAALLAALLAGWFILRESQPLLATALAPAEPASGASAAPDRKFTVYAKWFIHMRWAAIVVALMLIVVAVQGLELLSEEVWWPLVLTVAALAFLNLIYTFILRRRDASHEFLVFQAYADLLALTILLHFSGSVENPLAPLMLFHVIIAGIILTRGHCFAVAVAGSLLFASLAAAELAGVLEHYTLEIFPHRELGAVPSHAAEDPLYVASHVVPIITVLLLTAHFVTTLTDRLRRDQRELESYAERISTERQLLEQSLDTTGTALCVCGPDLQPMWHNRQWETWFGDATADKRLLQRIHGAGSPARRTISDGRTRIWEIDIDGDPAAAPSGDRGPRRTLLTTTAPLVGPDGEINRVVQLAQDVTEQKRTQASLMRAGQLAAIGEMAGEVAHEVNNPIAIISAKARLLLDNHRDEISDGAAEELTKITHMADRIARITRGLLSYSRSSATSHQPLDARVPVRKALSLVDQRASHHDVRIEDELPDGPLDVMGNAGELEQVFLNLFINGIDAMKGGGTLTVSALSEGAEYAIRVADTGAGIEADIREDIFKPFFTTKTAGEGTGLGLSICDGLVRSHGGTLELTSELLQGTTVTVRLPIRRSTEAAVEDG